MNKEGLKILIDLTYPMVREQLKYYFIGFGLLFGLLFFAYGMYLLGGINSKCMCEKVNIATYLNENLDRNCVAFAEKGYKIEDRDYNPNYLERIIGEKENGFNSSINWSSP